MPSISSALDGVEFEPFEGLPITSLTVSGNRVTREFVIRRELESRVGDPLRLQLLDEDVRRLQNLAIFSSIEVLPSTSAGGVAVELRVRELPAYLPFLAIQYSEENGFSAGPGILASNLFGRDISGDGSWVFGGTRTAAAHLINPWITGDHLSLDLVLRHLERDDKLNDFEETSDEITPWVGIYLGERGRVRGTVSYLRMRSDRDGVTLTADNIDHLLRVGAAIGYDSRDALRDPHEGWFAEFETLKTGGPLGGDGDFWTTTFDAQRFQPLGTRTLLIGGLLSLQAGDVGSDVPAYLQYRLGGANSLRGYDSQDLGKSLYGKNQLLFTTEYQVPLMPILEMRIGRLSTSVGVQLALFSDVGIAWNARKDLSHDRARVGGGLGIRLLIPSVDSLRLDFGVGERGALKVHFAVRSIMTTRRNRLR